MLDLHALSTPGNDITSLNQPATLKLFFDKPYDWNSLYTFNDSSYVSHVATYILVVFDREARHDICFPPVTPDNCPIYSHPKYNTRPSKTSRQAPAHIAQTTPTFPRSNTPETWPPCALSQPTLRPRLACGHRISALARESTVRQSSLFH